MTRIPYPDVTKLPETVQAVLAGTPLKIVRMAAHASPAIFEAQSKLAYAIFDPANLDPRLCETAILRVAHLSDSAYVLKQHLSLARKAGLSSEEIEAIGAQHYNNLEPVLAATARFTDEIVRNISPSDEALAALRSHVSDQALVNISLAVGHYMSIIRLIALAGISPDEQALTSIAAQAASVPS